jgi:hypothetical protein
MGHDGQKLRGKGHKIRDRSKNFFAKFELI